mmetsp:Transcript_25089/g.45189  ORF Transcript_25089/g.45189 Transcript_25089/m.45189 type:complete len:207 (+) Transcript_25089:418-1038(+)
MATKTAPHSIVVSSPVSTSFNTAPLTTFDTGASRSTFSPSSVASSASEAFPRISERTVFHRTLMEGCSMTRCAMTLEARKLSRRWITVTDSLVRANTNASSIAVSPPPTTKTCFPRYICPSHVAQLLTPPPRISYSPFTFNQLLSAPVATITACVSIVLEFVFTLIGLTLVSISITVSASKIAPYATACCLIKLTTAGPVTLNNPG